MIALAEATTTLKSIGFVHAEEVVGLEGSLEFAESLRAELQMFSREMSRFYRDSEDGLTLTARLALKFALDSYRMHARWAASAAAQLRLKLEGS